MQILINTNKNIKTKYPIKFLNNKLVVLNLNIILKSLNTIYDQQLKKTVQTIQLTETIKRLVNNSKKFGILISAISCNKSIIKLIAFLKLFIILIVKLYQK